MVRPVGMNRFFVFLSLWAVTGWGADAGPRAMRFTLRPDMLDLTNCVAEPGAVPLSLNATNLNLEVLDWKTGPLPTLHTGEFVLRLRAPMPVGSLITYGAGEVSYFSSNAWKKLAVEAESGRRLQVLPFADRERIESIKITVPAQPEGGDDGAAKTYRATLPFAALIPVRLAAISQGAAVTVSSLSLPAGDDSPTPWLNHPETLVDGFIDARRNFSTREREVPTRPDAPEWILLTWPEPRFLRGFAVWRGAEEEGLGGMKVEYFAGPGNPFESGNAADWRVWPVIPTEPGQFRSYQFFVGRQAVTSNGLRLSSTGEVRRVSLGEVTVVEQSGAK